MADEITLSTGTRETLLALQRAADARQQNTRRVATGLRVENATDAPTDFFRAQSLSNRVGDLLAVKDGVGQGRSTIETALAGQQAIDRLTQQMRGLAVDARGAGDEQRAAAASQFDTLRRQIDAIAADATYSGVSLQRDPPDDLSISLNETGTATLTVDGGASGADGLGIGSAFADFNGFASDADIDAALTALDGARETLRSRAAAFGSDVATLDVRERFTENLTNTLDAGAAKLVQADLNEEAARSLAIRVREGLGITGLQIARQGESLIGQLLGG